MISTTCKTVIIPEKRQENENEVGLKLYKILWLIRKDIFKQIWQNVTHKMWEWGSWVSDTLEANIFTIS